MKRLYILAVGLTIFTACQANPKIEKRVEIPKDSRQMLKVTTSNWNDRYGTMQRYEKKSNHWKMVGKSIPIILGRNGLGWGLGLHRVPKHAKYIKKEGDGRSPAGLFYLGNGFGYEPFKITFPYKVYKTTDHCVDDSNSKWYNKIIDSKRVKKDYKSFEHMKLKNNLYKYGITVNHNPNQIKNGGSCIFIHIRSGNGKGTAGCTAMNQDNIIKVLKWLKPKDKPLLLQLPVVEMSRIKFK
jgi:D-alanyl-D-alanine dipeptidase